MRCGILEKNNFGGKRYACYAKWKGNRKDVGANGGLRGLGSTEEGAKR